MTSTKVWTMKFNGKRWNLEADRGQVFPDDPGNGTPLLVVAPNGETSTLACTLGEGVISGDDQEVPQAVMDWLARIEDEASAWVYINDPNFK